MPKKDQKPGIRMVPFTGVRVRRHQCSADIQNTKRSSPLHRTVTERRAPKAQNSFSHVERHRKHPNKNDTAQELGLANIFYSSLYFKTTNLTTSSNAFCN